MKNNFMEPGGTSHDLGDTNLENDLEEQGEEKKEEVENSMEVLVPSSRPF